MASCSVLRKAKPRGSVLADFGRDLGDGDDSDADSDNNDDDDDDGDEEEN